jgi:hypothetical protein
MDVREFVKEWVGNREERAEEAKEMCHRWAKVHFEFEKTDLSNW